MYDCIKLFYLDWAIQLVQRRKMNTAAVDQKKGSYVVTVNVIVNVIVIVTTLIIMGV